MVGRRWIYILPLIGCIFVGSGTIRNTAAAAEDGDEGIFLRYKLQPGEQLVSQVNHFAQTRTKMSKHTEDSTSRTSSVKVWDVKDVSADGEMTFEYRIESVNLAQTVGESQEISYDSQSDTDVPDVFKHVAKTIGKPLATITINGRGQVVNRDRELRTPQLGMGELTLPLPEHSLDIGDQWSVPRELRVKLEDNTYKTIKVRELYTLEKVSAGVATLRIDTQPLTPITKPAVESQLIQQLSRGTIKFDIDGGRMLSKELSWSDEVIGFRGPETSLRYDAEFTEELFTAAERTAALSGNAAK